MPHAFTASARSFAFVAALLALASLASAQRTWIVDASNGPGTTHKDIPPALAAAADGDIIIVRAGSYSTFTTSKAVKILGQPGAKISVSKFSILHAVSVSGIGSGKTFVLKGLEIRGNPFRFPFAIQVTDCKGLVHLDRIVMPRKCFRFAKIWYCHGGILLRRCAQVMISDCSVDAHFPLDADSSTVSVCRSTFKGDDSRQNGSGITSGPGGNTPGILIVKGSNVTLSRVSATGGNGLSVLSRVRSSAPALSASSSSVSIAGFAPDAFTAGRSAGSKQPKPTSAITMSGGTLWLSATVKLVSNVGAPAVSGLHRRRIGAPVSLCARSAPPGSIVKVETVATPGESAYLLIGFPANPVQTAWGAFWLDGGSVALLGRSRLGKPPLWGISVPVPAIPAFRGLSIGFQVLSGIARSRVAPLRLSNGSVVVLD